MTRRKKKCEGKKNVLRVKIASDSSSGEKCMKPLSQFVPVLDARIPDINEDNYMVLNKMALLND